MAQKILSMAEYEKIDRINAEFAEHVMGWLAVGQRDVYSSNLNRDEKRWQGAPTRTDILRDVPRYWQNLEVAWSGFDTLPKDADLDVRRVKGMWHCHVFVEGFPPIAPSAGETPSEAIVRCLLKLAGHPLPKAE